MLSRCFFSSNKLSSLIGVRCVSTNTGVLYNIKKQPRESGSGSKSSGGGGGGGVSYDQSTSRKSNNNRNWQNNNYKSAGSNNNNNNSSSSNKKLIFKDEIKSVLDDLKIEQRGVINAEKYFKHRDKYDLILNSLNSDPKLDELILACQKLIELNEMEPLAAQTFNTDPLRKRTIDSLKRHLKDLKDADFFIAVQFMLLYDFNSFHLVQPHLVNRNKNFDLNQIIKLATVLRTSKVPREETSNLYRSYLSEIRESVEKIDNIKSLMQALVIFSFEPAVIKRLDQVAMRLVDNLTSQECAELINSKSILRQKNLLVLEACAYNIIRRKDQDKLGVEFVQKCLLSCGVLGFNEPQFFKSLLESLTSELDKNGTNVDWVKYNSKILESICTSIGIMKLRDDASLNALCSVLNKNKTHLPLDLIIKFVISCAHLYYKPVDVKGSEKEFKELIEFVKVDNFDLTLKEDQVKLINFVWSTCALDSADSNLVSAVLDESFWKPLLDSMNSKELKLFLMKLLNVNLYALALIENYQGHSMPESFDISQYTEILVPQESDEKNMLMAALSSMKKTDKYVKFRLLTPFGILIDALMVIDKQGEPCELSLSEKDDNDLIKVAFKLTQRNDYNSMNSTLNGVLSFQLRLLEELGYKTVTISKEELRSNSLTSRVSLIQKKLKKLVPVT